MAAASLTRLAMAKRHMLLAARGAHPACAMLSRRVSKLLKSTVDFSSTILFFSHKFTIISLKVSVNAVPAAASLTETIVAPMVEEADTVVDISHVVVTTAERLALATPSREESAREATDADTVTAAKVSSASKCFQSSNSTFCPLK
jgi:hypothetical protein